MTKDLHVSVPLPGSVIIGNSHMVAVSSSGLLAASFIHSGKAVSAQLEVSPLVTSRMQNSPWPLISMVGGNSYNVLAQIARGYPFDIADPSTRLLPPSSHQIVPLMAIRDALHLRAGRWLSVMTALAKAFRPIVHVDAPPPIRDSSYIHAGLRETMQRRGRTRYRITAPEVRYRLWELQRQIFRDAAAPFGAHFVPPPASACDADGFLRPEYWGDPSHANAEYGRLIVRQLQELNYVPSV